MGERENRDAESRDAATTTRSVNVVHYIERNQAEAAQLVAAVLERPVEATGGPTFLAILPSPDESLSFCEALRAHGRGAPRSLVPVTSVARGRRLLSAGATAIAGSPADLVRLIGESRLGMSHLHTLVLVWPEEILPDEEQRGFLESVISEVPRTTERLALCAARTAGLAQFLERSMWKARAVEHANSSAAASLSALRVATAVPAERVRALRAILDALDPDTAVLLSFGDESEAAARDAAALLAGDHDLLRVSRGVPDERFTLGIIFDEIPTADALTAAAAVANELVAIVRPAHLAGLQKVAPNATPLTWTGALASARSAHDVLRDEIRGYAASGSHLPWIPLIEPLLEGMDSVEVAAVALALLDRERRKAKRSAPVAPTPPPARDERAAREGPSREFGARPRDKRDDTRGDRPERGFPKKRPTGAWGGGQRDARKRDADPRRGPPRDRSDRPRRDAPGGSRGRDDSRERGGRPGEIERVPRAANEGREWSERGERLKNSRKGPRGGEGA